MEAPIFSGLGGQQLQQVLQALGVQELTPLLWNVKNANGEIHLDICWKAPIIETSSNEQGPVSGPNEEGKEKLQCSAKTVKKRKSPATVKRDKDRFRRWVAGKKRASSNGSTCLSNPCNDMNPAAEISVKAITDPSPAIDCKESDARSMDVHVDLPQVEQNKSDDELESQCDCDSDAAVARRRAGRRVCILCKISGHAVEDCLASRPGRTCPYCMRQNQHAKKCRVAIFAARAAVPCPTCTPQTDTILPAREWFPQMMPSWSRRQPPVLGKTATV